MLTETSHGYKGSERMRIPLMRIGETIPEKAIDQDTKYLALSDIELDVMITGLSEILVKRTNMLSQDVTHARLHDMQACVFLLGKCHQLRETSEEAS